MHHRLNQYPDTNRYIIAFSGGVDSHVLLHCIQAIQFQPGITLSCVHVNHGLNQQSHNWGGFCRDISDQYGIDFKELHINAAPPAGASIEAWAREARYRLIAGEMSDGDVLITAHHGDDQLETILLHLLRGSGPRGLSGMRGLRTFAGGWHARPMLEFNRRQILQYAVDNKLKYIVDESNRNPRYHRAFLRENILPELKKRWPGLNKSLTRVADHQLFITELLDALGARDLKIVCGPDLHVIDLDEFGQLSRHRQINLITYWLRTLDLPAPARTHLDEIIKNIILSKPSRTPCVTWPGVEIRRYRKMMYASKPLPAHTPDRRYPWNINKPLTLSYGVLRAVADTGAGLAKDQCKPGRVSVRYRLGGEKIRPQKRRRSITLKNLFQEHGVIPWYRNRIPLIYIDNLLVAVPGLCIDDRFAAKADQPSWQLIWECPDKVIQHYRSP